MKQQGSPQAPIVWVVVAFAIVYIVWGSTYFFIQTSLVGFPPFVLGAVRFTLSGVMLLLWCAYKKEPLFQPLQIRHSWLAGNLLLFVGNGSIIWAEAVLPSSFAAVLASAVPIWFILLDGQNRKANLTNTKVLIGVVTGFAGVILLFGQQLFSHSVTANSSLQVISMLVIVIGNISWAGGSLYSKYHSSGSVLVSAAWQMIAAAVSFFAVALLSGEFNSFRLTAVPSCAWWSVIYLVTMGSLAGYSAYIWLLSVRPATQVSTNAYVNPVVAVLLGAFLGGELIGSLQLIGLAMILSSVFIINLDKYKRKPAIPA